MKTASIDKDKLKNNFKLYFRLVNIFTKGFQDFKIDGDIKVSSICLLDKNRIETKNVMDAEYIYLDGTEILTMGEFFVVLKVVSSVFKEMFLIERKLYRYEINRDKKPINKDLYYTRKISEWLEILMSSSKEDLEFMFAVDRNGNLNYGELVPLKDYPNNRIFTKEFDIIYKPDEKNNTPISVKDLKC